MERIKPDKETERLSRRQTNIEMLMDFALKKAGIEATFNFPVRAGYILDFAIIDLKIDIECDGEAWHSSRQAIRHDQIRNHILKKKGWTIIRFTGTEIENNIDNCILKIKNIIEKEVIENGKSKS